MLYASERRAIFSIPLPPGIVQLATSTGTAAAAAAVGLLEPRHGCGQPFSWLRHWFVRQPECTFRMR